MISKCYQHLETHAGAEPPTRMDFRPPQQPVLLYLIYLFMQI